MEKFSVEWIKLSPRYLLPIVIVSGIMIFADDNLITYLGIETFLAKYRPYIALVFLTSTALTFSNFIIYLWNKFSTRMINKRKFKEYKRNLHQLTRDEKLILYGYLHNETKTLNFPMSDGRLTELICNKVIYQSSNLGTIDEFPYNIQPWDWKYLHEHKTEIFTAQDIAAFEESGFAN